MQLWEGITLAVNQIRTEKLKSFFTVLGVIIGVMFLIVVVSVGLFTHMGRDTSQFTTDKPLVAIAIVHLEQTSDLALRRAQHQAKIVKHHHRV